MADSLILMVMALVVFGPRRLPQIGRQIGKLMYEFRKASNDFKFQMEEELRNSEEADRRKKEEEERQKQLAAAAPPAAQLEASVGAQADSQVSDASPPPHGPEPVRGGPEPGAPEDSSTAAADTSAPPSTDDLYSYGDTYGELAEAQVKTLTKVPTIQPPATGAPVQAAWPGSDGTETGTAGTGAAETSTVKRENEVKGTAVEEASKAAEPAHNG